MTQTPSAPRGRAARTAVTAGMFLLAAGSGLAAWRLGERVMLESAGVSNGDSDIYWAMGRGLLNGLVPYRDLFETKPPGVFLVTAASLALGGRWFGHLLSGLSYLAIALAPAAWALRAEAGQAPARRWTMALMAFLAGTLLALYAGERSGEFQVESLGAGAAAVFIAAAAWPGGGRVRIAVAACALLAAAGLKEPFLLTCAAGALLLARNPRETAATLWIPAGIAVAAGAAVMAAAGFLLPYLGLYLPEMLGGPAGEPLWAKAADAHRLRNIASDIAAFSVPLAAFLCGAAALHCMAGPRAGALWWRLMALLAALALVNAGVHASGLAFYPHHFSFLLPSALALTIAALRAVPRGPGAPRAIAHLLLAAPLLSGAFLLPDIAVRDRLRSEADTVARLEAQAAVIDGILDACPGTRYLYLGPNGRHPYGHTRHSPTGPLFFQYDFMLAPERPALREAFLRQLREAELLVRWDGPSEFNSLRDGVEADIAERFAPEPWPCAGEPRLDGYTLLFRRG